MARVEEYKRGRGETHSTAKLKRVVAQLGNRGLCVVDPRTRVGRALMEWRAQLITDLGGQEALSTQQLAIVDIAVRTKLILDTVDSYLMQQDNLMIRSKRTLYPVVMQRTALADAMARYLGTLGLARQAKNVTTLHDVLKGGGGKP